MSAAQSVPEPDIGILIMTRPASEVLQHFVYDFRRSGLVDEAQQFEALAEKVAELEGFEAQVEELQHLEQKVEELQHLEKKVATLQADEKALREEIAELEKKADEQQLATESEVDELNQQIHDLTQTITTIKQALGDNE